MVAPRFSWLRRMSIGKILEVGCGDAITFYNFHDVDWTGVDVDYQEGWDKTLKGRNFIQADAYDMTDLFEPETFDTLVYAEVLEHVKFPKKFLRHGIQFLKPGGRVLITIPDEYSWDEGLGAFEHPDHIHFFKPEEIQDIIEIPGTRVVQFIHTPKAWNGGFVFWYIVLRKDK